MHSFVSQSRAKIIFAKGTETRRHEIAKYGSEAFSNCGGGSIKATDLCDKGTCYLQVAGMSSF